VSQNIRGLIETFFFFRKQKLESLTATGAVSAKVRLAMRATVMYWMSMVDGLSRIFEFYKLDRRKLWKKRMNEE